MKKRLGPRRLLLEVSKLFDIEKKGNILLMKLQKEKEKESTEKGRNNDLFSKRRCFIEVWDKRIIPKCISGKNGKTINETKKGK